MSNTTKTMHFDLNDLNELNDLSDEEFNAFMIQFESAPEDKKECTCGAKHTSRPNYHLRYCDLSK